MGQSSTERQPTEVLEGWEDGANGATTFEWRVAVKAGDIVHALEDLEASNACRTGLRIVKAPSSLKGVYAERAVAKGALVMVPFSPNISAKKDATKGSDIDLGITILDNQKQVRRMVISRKDVVQKET